MLFVIEENSPVFGAAPFHVGILLPNRCHELFRFHLLKATAKNVARMQGIGNDVPMTHDQRQKALQYGLCTEESQKPYRSANDRKIFAWAHNLGTANQSSQEAIELFEVDRCLLSNRAKIPLRRSNSASVNGSNLRQAF